MTLRDSPESNWSREQALVREVLSDLPLEEIVILSVVPSTNDIAKRRLEVRNPVLVLAESQRRGRGKGGRTWESPPGGLWFSLGLRESVGDLSLVPILTGIAVAEGLRNMAFDARVKWPNDVLIDNKKVAGILVEATVRGDCREVVIGIGVNVNICEKELQTKVKETRVGTLSGIAGHPVPKAEVLSHILRGFFHLWQLWRSGQTDSIVQRWKELSLTLNREVTVTRNWRPQQIVGVAVDLAPDGSLLIRDVDGLLQRVVDGQIS
ncbi:MAG: biotin--[acetyl-CoA-carboxylase] ligase [Candidatus Bipolaricaulota bacterium]